MVVLLRVGCSLGVIALACALAGVSSPSVARAYRQVTPSPSASLTPAPSMVPSPSPEASVSSPEVSASPTASPPPTASPSPTATPTLPPITVQPQTAQVPIGTTQTVSVGGVLGAFTAVAHDTQIVDVSSDQGTRTVSLVGKTPGATTVTITDSRGVSADVNVRVAYNAGIIAPEASVNLTGDPASADFVRDRVAQAVRQAAQLRPGAQILVGNGDVPFNGRLDQDNVAVVDVPVVIQGNGLFSVDGSTRVRVENVAAPRISPDSLMVSDFPERLTENGTLFTADLRRDAPSRFLYFHYNPPEQPDRRIVLIAQNDSTEPALVQFISGSGGPGKFEMEVGHAATAAFLVHAIQNEGHLIEIPGSTSLAIAQQDLPAGSIVCNLLQLRVLSGAGVHLTLVAQNASDAVANTLSNGALLTSTVLHARGIYRIPEFHYARQWNVTDEYLELPIGQIPLPNTLQGEALAGDYGVLQAFVVNVQNPLSTPQAIAIYENPRGGRATGTYIIDGVLVQSHQAPPFSRYKLRQYVVPARGFVRVTIVTMAEAGSSYPLRLVFAPDDGSVAPGGPGSPVY